MKTEIETKSLNKKERRSQRLLAHYATCERLARALGMPAAKIDGKKISVALWKAEKIAHRAATAHCNGEIDEDQFENSKATAQLVVKETLGKLPPGFFVNGDPRGYALKIDAGRDAGETPNPEAQRLIAAVKLHTDWGGYGILSPEINGDL